jgi:hypothetical protein
MTYTLTYSESVQGWPSFYSFYPEWIIGMNNYMYTFKGGDLYRHNVNNSRNTFYVDWWIKYANDPALAFTSTRMVSVFNDVPLENKLFKTINLEGDASWDANLYTDIQNSGIISSLWFEKKEQSYYAFVRNSGEVPAGQDEYPLRSLNGIGRSLSYTPIAGGYEIDFSVSPLIDTGSMLSIGDYLYFALPPSYDTPLLAGQVTDIIRNYPMGINRIVIDSTIPGCVPLSIADPYFLYIKNAIAESHGVLGHYCVFDISNGSSDKIELFSVESEVMKSFP